MTDGTGQIQYSYGNDELRQIQINDPESGTVYRFENDEFGNTKATYVGDRCLVSQTYEEKNGNLLAETYGNGYVYQYTYDDMDRVTGIRLTDPSGEENTGCMSMRMTGKETLRWYGISGKNGEKKPSRPDIFMTYQEDLSITGTTGTTVRSV